MTEIAQNIFEINQRIERACKNAGRNPDEVKLLLATKTVTPERIKMALETGQMLIAENKVQELKSKYEDLKDVPHTNHFIGHLQTNKINDILKCDVVCLQSLDRIELAQKLHNRLSTENKTLDILIQVNTSNEESKFGVSPDGVFEFLQQVAELKSIKIKGLMTIGLFSADIPKVRNCFKLLKNLQMQIKDMNVSGVEMKELSMGMSHDFEVAIEEGATIVRVGTAVFGARKYPDSYYWNENK